MRSTVHLYTKRLSSSAAPAIDVSGIASGDALLLSDVDVAAQHQIASDTLIT